MAEKTELSISIMPKLEEKVVDLSSKLEALMRDKAPEAWDAALGVVQVNALQSLVSGAVGIILLCVGVWMTSRFLPIAINSKADHAPTVTPEIIALAGAAASITGFLLAIIKLFDAWVYVALLRPELAIAKQVMRGLL